MTNRSQTSGQRTAICHFSLVIGHFLSLSLSGLEKKCSVGFQPAKVLLTQKELSRLTCRRHAGATIFSHDQRLCGESPFGCGYAAPGESTLLTGKFLAA